MLWGISLQLSVQHKKPHNPQSDPNLVDESTDGYLRPKTEEGDDIMLKL